NKVEFYLNQELIKSHLRVPKGKRQTDWSDYPPQKAAFFQRNPVWCRQRAAELGREVGIAVSSLLSSHALHFLRQSQGIIRLADKYGSDRLNAACARANAFGDSSYRTVRNILEKGLDAQQPLPIVTDSSSPAFLRGVDGLFNLKEKNNAKA
ncbi:MAG: IS21 family transposase, partial [Dehalococcoidia bacterium]|nr:IS21 family transposase [Dehalococcoidia bacterium]